MYIKDKDSAGTDKKVTNYAKWRIKRWRIRRVLLVPLNMRISKMPIVWWMALIADLKSVTKSCIESVKRTRATENEQKIVGQW